MTIFNTRILTASTLMGIAGHASAHEAKQSATLFHYMTSPDHVAIFGLLVLAATVTYTYLKSARLRAKKIDKN